MNVNVFVTRRDQFKPDRREFREVLVLGRDLDYALEVVREMLQGSQRFECYFSILDDDVDKMDVDQALQFLNLLNDPQQDFTDDQRREYLPRVLARVEHA